MLLLGGVDVGHFEAVHRDFGLGGLLVGLQPTLHAADIGVRQCQPAHIAAPLRPRTELVRGQLPLVLLAELLQLLRRCTSPQKIN